MVIKGIEFVSLGENGEGKWGFRGYVDGLKMWDEGVGLKDK